MSINTTKLPDVLAVQRATIITDGVMYSIMPNDSDDHPHETPIRVMRHGIRGTLPEIDKKAKSVANPQRTESAHTHPDAIGLRVRFGFGLMKAGPRMITSCSDPQFRIALNAFIDKHFRNDCPEFVEVTRRMARNILNGRWLWRNRDLGSVVVTATTGKGGSMTKYSGAGSTLESFENYTADEIKLAHEVIAASLLGTPVRLLVRADIDTYMPGAIEVFPSQNMVTKKPDGFARSLYKIKPLSRQDLRLIFSSAKKDGEEAGEFMSDQIHMGDAALRDQKIGNAIRCIDTWYPEHPTAAFAPIPIEPNGASLDANCLFRKKGNDANAILSSLYVQNRQRDLLDSGGFNGNIAYLIGLLIRGGVFSEGEEKKGGDK